MKKLRIILHSRLFYIILIIITILYSFIYLNYIPKKSKINVNLNSFTGVINNIKIDGDLLTLELKQGGKVIGYHYFKTLEEKNNFIQNFQLGDTVFINGTFTEPKNNTVPNLFNYKKYLEKKKIYYVINIDNYNKVKNNRSIFYNIKNTIMHHIDRYKCKEYLYTWILGNNDLLDQMTTTTYREIGISHLLAISGMHISLLAGILLMLFNKIKLDENKSYLITIIILFFFMFLSGNSASVCRSVVLFSLLWLNKLFHFELKTINLLIITFCILVSINPNILFDIGFEFSFLISFYLSLLQNNNEDSYLKKALKVSVVSFFASLPISIYYFYQINLLSIIFNLFFVPLVSIIIFPFSLITFFIPSFDFILSILISFMEKIAYWCNQISFSKLVFMKPSLLWIVLYYICLTLFLRKKKLGIIFIIWLVFIQYFYLILFPQNYFMMVDVGQGDCFLIHSNNKTVLIDTGGKIKYFKEEWQNRKIKSLTETTLLPLLKSLGIKKLDYLVLTHGDYDHMGEAINLVNNFKVEKVIFNCGEFNDLEKELIKVLNKKKIPYYSCIKELNIDKNKLYFLQTKEYDNENDNSNVIYTELDGYKFMFMGDASIITEKEILDKYSLPDIDVLKVGHHGSKTSSGKEFINEINPKYSVISVGKNNRYGHPNKEVLDNLKNSKIYRTDIDGSIMFRINKNKLKIETCVP